MPTHKRRPGERRKDNAKNYLRQYKKSKYKRKKDKKMTMIVALIGVGTLGLLAANVVSSYTMEAVGANA